MGSEFLVKAAGLLNMFNTCLRALALSAIALVLFSCPARDAANAGASSPGDMAKAFADAKAPLLKQAVNPRDFALPVLAPAAAPQSLSALKGKVVFLNFWATWCGPCRTEMPSMEALYNRFRDRGFEILAVNSGEKEQEVLNYMRNNSLTFPAALDEDGRVSRVYGIQAIPTTFILDREGKIILRMVGSIDWNTPAFHAALETLLNSAP
jgi:thiol-disulfide isomerase/thioredoxin